jgi:competence protein ComEC
VIAAVLLAQYNGMYIAFLDVGQGDTAFLKTVQGGEYFIDGGREASKNEVVGFTIRNGYNPGAAFVSHTDDDHFSGIKALYEAGLLDKVYCSWQEEGIVKAAMPEAEVVPLGAGDTVLLDEATKALVLYPYKDIQYDDKNDSSLVLLVEYKDKYILFAGDISGVTETQIFAGLKDVDIYKAAHHGSKQSSYRLPLSVLRPKYSVICVGKNKYGQPDARAAANLSDYSGKVFSTMNDMAIEFYIDDDITVKTYGGYYE